MIKRIEKVFSEVTGKTDVNFTEKTKIDKQFQYNQYIRDFFEDNDDKYIK